MTPNEQKAKAAELMEHWLKQGSVPCWVGTSPLEQWLATHIVPKLATPDHEAALAACEGYANHFGPKAEFLDAAPRACFEVGRRSLDAKKPKERWTWEADGKVFYDGKLHCQFHCGSITATVYAADMNAKGAGR